KNLQRDLGRKVAEGNRLVAWTAVERGLIEGDGPDRRRALGRLWLRLGWQTRCRVRAARCTEQASCQNGGRHESAQSGACWDSDRQHQSASSRRCLEDTQNSVEAFCTS